MTDYTIAVVRDALTVLDLVGDSKKGLTLTEITEMSDLGKNKVFRILHTLQQSRMIHRDENGRFHLGLRIAELAQNVHIHDLLLDVCNPVMDALVEQSQESIFLGIVSDTNALCIATRESPRSMRLFARVGIQVPLYTGGVPKVLLANMQPKEREKLLVYFQSSGEAIDWDALQSKLAEIRTQGYSITINELDEGAHSITAPIFDSQGKVIAAMSIAGPSIRFSDEAIQRYIDLITSATQQISSTLGYTSFQDVSNREMLSQFT